MKAHWTTRHVLTLLAVVALIAIVLTPTAFAQTPSYKDPEGILAWLKLQAIAVSFVLTMVWKYVPVLKDMSNRALPWLNLAGWIVAQTAGVGVAQAAGVAGAAAHQSFAHVLAVGLFNSAIAKVIWDGWLKPTAGAWLDHQLGRKPQTP